MTYENFVYTLTERVFDIKDINIPSSTLKYLENIGIFSCQDIHGGNYNIFNIFGAIKAKIYQNLRQIGFTKARLLEVKKFFDSNILDASVIKLSEDRKVYNLPITRPVMLSLTGVRNYLLISAQGEVDIINEEGLIEYASFGKDMELCLNGKIIIDLLEIIGSLGIEIVKGKGVLKKIGKIISGMDGLVFTKGEKLYAYTKYHYSSPKELDGTVINEITKPDTSFYSKSNNTGRVTFIEIIRKIQLDNSNRNI